MDVLLFYVLPVIICWIAFYLVFKGVTMKIGVLAMAIFLSLVPVINIVLATVGIVTGFSSLKIWNKEITL